MPRARQEDPMPEAWSDKDERQYEHIKESASKRGRSAKTAKRIAAATVNKERASEGRTGSRKGAAKKGGSKKRGSKKASSKKGRAKGGRKSGGSRKSSKSRKSGKG